MERSFRTLRSPQPVGLRAPHFEHLFTGPSRIWSIGPSASQLIFDGGLYRAELHQYSATYNSHVANYRQTVLTAFQQVEDNLAAVRISSQQIQREKEALASAQQFLQLSVARYETGVDPYLNVLIAQNTVFSDEETVVTLQIQQMVSAVALIQALGGGWDRSQLPTPSQVSQKIPGADYKLQK